MASALAILITLLPGRVHGQQTLDFNAIVQETQKYSQSASEFKLVNWLPEVFWQAAAQDPNETAAQVDPILATIRPYTMIAVVAGDIGPLGGITYRDERTIRNGIRIEDTKGRDYAPLAIADIDPDMKNVVTMINH